MTKRDGGLPIEEFIQALTAQLDRAQVAMSLKARAGLPLTFAVKDLSLDLRTHVEMVGSAVRITPAGPGEAEASTLHLSLTTITRPMIEENTFQLAAQPDEPSLKEAVGNEISEEEQRRLEWAGIHSVSQFRELQSQTGDQAIERVANIPALRLRAALERATHPFVNHVSMDQPSDDGPSNGIPLLRIRGHNLMGEQPPEVRIGGEPVPIIQANARELVVAPQRHQTGGSLVVETAPGKVVEMKFNLDAFGAIPAAGEVPPGNGGAQ